MVLVLTLSNIFILNILNIIRGYRLGDKYTPVIQKALMNLKNITNLNLSHNRLSNNGAKNFFM